MRKKGSSQSFSFRSRTRLQQLQDVRAVTTDAASQHGPQDKVNLRAGLAVIGARTAGALSRRLHLGGGTSIAGVVAQCLYPDIVKHLASQVEHGSITVTGTNGKTTTCSLIAAILGNSGLRVWHNREGSNLMRGIASSLAMHALPNGQLRKAGRAISVFEVDEAVLPQIVRIVHPRVAVFTNLFRDQLDRYGEVDSIASHWREAIRHLPSTTTLVLNADDPATAYLGKDFTGKILYYGIDDPALDLEAQHGRHQVIDMRTCPACASDYAYELRFYSHLGHYVCSNCGLRRPQPDVRVLHAQSESFDRLRIQVETAQHRQEIVISLPGLYNIYNALAAITAAEALHIGWESILSGIEQAKPVFGRGEYIQAEGRTICLLLAKNPTGFNEVLRTLFSNDTAKHLLFLLNDNTADGRDISWIWDVDFERVVGHTQTLAVSGTRALDLALRLKYAGVAQQEMTIVPSLQARAQHLHARGPKAPQQDEHAIQRHYGLKSALDIALSQTPPGETLFVVPTYTALLEVHRELEQRGLTSHYWEGAPQ